MFLTLVSLQEGLALSIVTVPPLVTFDTELPYIPDLFLTLFIEKVSFPFGTKNAYEVA